MRLLIAAVLMGQIASPAPKELRGARLFIAPMDGKLDGFLAAEIMKRALPVVIVTEEKDADFVLAGASIRTDYHWYEAGRDKNEGNVQLLDVGGKQVVWAAEAGDRSVWWGALKRGGQRKVAERIVAKMKKDLFAKR